MSELVKYNVKRGTVRTLLGDADGMCVRFQADDVPIGSMSFNFDPTDQALGYLIDKIGDPATREDNQHTTEPFMVVYWGMHKVMLAAKGDIPERPAVRMVLVDKDGETIEFVSKGVLTSMDAIRLRYGDGPYDPPLPVYVEIVKLPNKWEMTKLRVRFPAEPAKKAK